MGVQGLRQSFASFKVSRILLKEFMYNWKVLITFSNT